MFADEPPFAAPHASTSTTRLKTLSITLFTVTLILLVVMFANVNCRQTLLLPVTLPFGTVTQLVPFQYCTSNAVMPQLVNVMSRVGSTGLLLLSCCVTTSISLIVFVPLKSISTQSGKL